VASSPDGPQLSADKVRASDGTPSYLAPEQLRGQGADKRSDLFSLGLVLYEMTTGQRAFGGKTVQEIHDAVLNSPAKLLRQVRADAPVEFELLLQRAMEKDPGQRYQSAREMRTALEHARKVLVPSELENASVAGSRAGLRILLPASAVVAVALALSAFYVRSHRAAGVTDRDEVVLADFSNSTGDPVFDISLKQGLGVALSQSPFLSVVSDEKVASSLKLMTRPTNTPLTPELAREVCERSGGTAFISGSIAALGQAYVIGLNAEDCRTGDVLGREQVTAPSREKVIAALGEAASKLRNRLGESLAAVQQHDVPLEQATTSSLEALQAYTLAHTEALHGSYLKAIPLYQRAIEFDPNFASAYAHLGQAYANSAQEDLAVGVIRKAFELRDRTSDLERFYIETRYYELVEPNSEKRIESLQLWEQMYPRDGYPHNDLASEYGDTGRFEEALREAQITVGLEPDIHTPYEVLGVADLGLNRFADLKAVRQQEIERKLDYHWDHIDLQMVAFLEGDKAGMEREEQWIKGNKYESLMLKAVAGEEAAQGKLRQARETCATAIGNAHQNGLDRIARTAAVDCDLAQVLLGVRPALSQETREAISLKGTDTTLSDALRVYSMLGDVHASNTIAAGLEKLPDGFGYTRNLLVPAAKAELEIEHDPQKAVDLINPTEPYSFAWKTQNWATYTQARALLSAHRPTEAAQEFQKILDHPGICAAHAVSPVVYALARLGLARARAMAGDTAAARAAYQQFFDAWKDADPDVPVLQQARAEFARLQ